MGFAVVLASVALILGSPSPGASGRDDTAALQAQLDAGGTVSLPSLPDGQCYATHGLWVSLDGTSIVSDGACIVALGPGPVRLHSPDGDPIAADAVFFVNRSSEVNAAPHGVTISGLRLVVPRSASMFGIEIFATDVTIERVRVEGEPVDSLLVGGRAYGNPAAGIDVEPNSPADPIAGVRISGNRIEGNAGPGILLALPPAPAAAPSIEISGNRITGNGLKPTPPVLGGIVAPAGAPGVTIGSNVIGQNNGPDLIR